MNDILIGYIAGLGLVMIICFCFLLYYLLRNLRFGNSPSRQQSDLTNMMLLFQTMRDTLEQQKQLAQDFNASVDQKVGEIKKHIESAGTMSDSVKKAEQELETLLSQTREELDSLRRRMEYLVDQNPDVEMPTILEENEPNTKPESGAVNGHISHSQNGDMEPLGSIPEPKSESENNLIDQWVGLDIGAQAEEDWGEEELSNQDEDADSGRDAFRSLLNMQSPDPEEDSESSTVPPIQQKVYEYADEGMRVPEISRALGIGKGEVRLILSLRQSNLG
jgi:hypothetical protein